MTIWFGGTNWSASPDKNNVGVVMLRTLSTDGNWMTKWEKEKLLVYVADADSKGKPDKNFLKTNIVFLPFWINWSLKKIEVWKM